MSALDPAAPVVFPRGWTIAEHLAARGRGITARVVIDAVLQLLAELDDPAVLIGAPLVELARRAADEVDAGDPTLPLHGVPFVVKDNIDVGGVATTAGCASFAYLAERDAVVVARLRAAGAIPVAKVNLDQFATGLVGTRSPYGTPRHPRHPELIPGGSSSGSAVAVALGLVPFSLGTDTAGSGRVPAALCGLVGFKPTVGRLPNTGSVPAVRRIDCITAFATAVGDARVVVDLAAGPDAGDAWSRPAAPRPGPIRRLGVPRDLEDHCDPAVVAAFAHSVAELTRTEPELTVVSVDIAPLLEAGSWLYGGPLVAERAVALEAFLATDPPDLDPTVANIITAALGARAVDAYRQEYDLARARRQVAAWWDDIDALVLPTIPGVATGAEVAADPIGRNAWLGRFTTFVNLFDFAALAIPLGMRTDGLPHGVQLIGPAWSDDALADLAASALGEAPSVHSPAPGPGEQTIVVVGAHLSGMALNHQLTSRGGRLLAATRTAPCYRLHALVGTVPPKPGLRRVAQEGASLAVELWALPHRGFATFVAEVPPPLAIGTVELEDGSSHPGFVCEPYGLDNAPDVTRFGGWRAYVEQQ